ncbi:hypothetical protein CLOM_g7729 [Closterium sp. NIES-68]|nr:hypothetical protein CLOM_g7729 [Closterium sp. NIES-68]GJP77540.1 hypothetical protein CLOP_g7916 [Closterium sp. NIES-67]
MGDSLRPKGFRELVQIVTKRCRDTCTQHAAELLGDEKKSPNVIPKAAQIELKELSSRLTSAIDSVASVTKDPTLQETASPSSESNQLLEVSNAQAEALEAEIKELALIVKQRRTKVLDKVRHKLGVKLERLKKAQKIRKPLGAVSAKYTQARSEIQSRMQAVLQQCEETKTKMSEAAKKAGSMASRLHDLMASAKAEAARIPSATERVIAGEMAKEVGGK